MTHQYDNYKPYSNLYQILLQDINFRCYCCSPSTSINMITLKKMTTCNILSSKIRSFYSSFIMGDKIYAFLHSTRCPKENSPVAGCYSRATGPFFWDTLYENTFSEGVGQPAYEKEMR